jgi:hypothetical protein
MQSWALTYLTNRRQFAILEVWNREPKTLQEAVVYFANQDNCRNYLVARRWPKGVICPRCGSNKVVFLPKYNRWQCSVTHDARQFTSKTGTIMEESPIGLDKWLMAMWLIVNCKNGISSYEIHRAIGVTQKSAWFLDHRIRLALHNGSFENLLSGECEADETFIGGKARNMHKEVRERKITGTGGKDKTMPCSESWNAPRMVSRAKVRTKVVSTAARSNRASKRSPQAHVEAGSALYTDDLNSYEGMNEFEHQVVDHAIAIRPMDRSTPMALKTSGRS